MRSLPLLVLAVLLCANLASADPSNLGGGVLIAHHPPGLQFTSGQDWCDRYENEFAIDSCQAQNNRIDINGNVSGSVWYVLAAWDEGKEFCAAEFGLGSYTAANYSLVEYGPCGSDVLTIPTSNWPGPGEGISLAVAQEDSWSGTFLPIYYFAGYAYGEDLIPLTTDPAQQFAGFSNCAVPPVSWDASVLGGMGIRSDGTYACYGGGEGLDGGEEGLDGNGFEHDVEYIPPRNPSSTVSVYIDPAAITFGDRSGDIAQSCG